MTVQSEFPISADASIPGLHYDAIRMVVRYEAQERDLLIPQDTDDGVSLRLSQGQMFFAPDERGVTVTIRAGKPERLQLLKERLEDWLANAHPQLLEQMRWTGAQRVGDHPPNFFFAEVVSSGPVGNRFLRVRAKASDLSSFQNDSIHFRLVLAPGNFETAEWPIVTENGSTIWPKGEKTLHRPVYTVRSVDHDANTFEFDVFLHEGGRVTDWVGAIQPGVRFGVTGPVGGGIPQTDRIVAFADETGFPALARILETMPSTSIGHIVLLADGGRDGAYPMPLPGDVGMTWLRRNERVDLVDLALTALNQNPDHFLWFATERQEVLRLRMAYKDRKGDPSQAYIASYWSRS